MQVVSSSCEYLSSCYRLQKKKTLFLIGPHQHYSVMKDIIGSLISNLGELGKDEGKVLAVCSCVLLPEKLLNIAYGNKAMCLTS